MAEKAGHDRVGNSSTNKKGKLCHTRYFIIKSLNHHNIQLSIENGIWATQVRNEPILEEAFRNSGRVILIYSVNMSGFFQGYAQMLSSVGWRHDNLWSEGSGKSNPWGRSFKVKWLQLNDLPFQKTLHLKNPLNDYKPVKISRDCQELPEDIGEALCELIDGGGDADGIVKSFPRDELPMKRPCIDPSTNTGDGEYTVPPLQVPWGRTPLPYPSFLYQQHDEASRFHLAHQGFTGVGFTDNALSSSASKVARMQQSRKTTNLRIHCEMPSRTDIWGLSAGSPLASTLTDDDFLEMTYEEYLEVHSRSIKQLNPPAAGPSQTTQEPPRNKKHDDDLKSSFVTGQGRSRKRSHSRNSSEK
ncbi:YTH YT521-B HOMOLOGY DOMAIN-CONTAINING [Salix purpurea]|uniref:YTH domain-containing family protein n=1 Tax=Salix purpurea TaxID=77065 RepID=A0A9Q0TIR6_SALPP|nr:YTH YT521-B HOMOLOGY DOMAIN-CONTAINING [Salix purpurea]